MHDKDHICVKKKLISQIRLILFSIVYTACVFSIGNVVVKLYYLTFFRHL